MVIPILKILAQPPIPVQPPETPLNYPAPGQGPEPSLPRRPSHHLDLHPHLPAHHLTQSAICQVHIYSPEGEMPPLHMIQQLCPHRPIRHICRCYPHLKGQPESVGAKMAFPPLHFFSRHPSPARRRFRCSSSVLFTGWLSMSASLGSGASPACWCTSCRSTVRMRSQVRSRVRLW